MIEWIISILLLVGGFLIFVAGLGIFRMPDTFIRMHASTKAGTLGIGLILLALALFFQQTETTARAIGTGLFLLITAPVAAHLIGRAVYRSGAPFYQKVAIKKKNIQKDQS